MDALDAWAARDATWPSLSLLGAPVVVVTGYGELTPYTRVGQERWTPRARAYLSSRDRARSAMRTAVERSDDPSMFPLHGPLVMLAAVWRYARRGDSDNFGKALADSANGVLYLDDKQVLTVTTTLRYVPREAEGWNVTLWELPPCAGTRPTLRQWRQMMEVGDLPCGAVDTNT